jgi:hypothetical protein
MPYQLTLGEDRFLRFTMQGDMDGVSVDNFNREYQLYLQASTPEAPIYMIVFAENLGRTSPKARNLYMQMNSDKRLGLVAIIKPPRVLRVLAQFILKASGRTNIRFFESENDAVMWIQQNKVRTDENTKPLGGVPGTFSG